MADRSTRRTTQGATAATGAPTSGDPVPRAVGRAFDLLEIVVDAGAINLTSAAGAAGLTPTTALRHLRALEALGYVRRDDDGDFVAGRAVFQLGATARRTGPVARLAAAAQPVLDELTAATGESSYLAIAEGDRAVYLATSESDRSIRHVGWVGRSVPLAGTAVGEALTGRGGVHVRCDTVEPDIAAIAHAIGAGTEVPAALSVIGPAQRMMASGTAAAISAAVTDAVRRLELALTGAAGVVRA